MEKVKKEHKKSKQRQRPVAEEDERFAHISKNPIFRRVPKDKRKIDIDSRFMGMFNDDRFKLKYKVDKRGKPINLTTDENMKRYYNLVEEELPEHSQTEKEKLGGEDTKLNTTKIKEVDEESGSSETSETDSDQSGSDSDQSDVEQDEQEVGLDESEKNSLPEKLKSKLRDEKIDYARGEGTLLSSEESSDDSSVNGDPLADQDEEVEDLSHAWGELDRDAPRTEEITKRLALCNMDWDRVKAEDLMVLFNSFLPAGGVLKYVAIYTSEYGKQRLEEEEMYGPQELRDPTKPSTLGRPLPSNSDSEQDQDGNISGDDEQNSGRFDVDQDHDYFDHDDNDNEEDEGSEFHMEKLRKYQLNRLKYYYAVLEFDTAETANTIYTECDGLEFESSATKIDLRFIPDETTFDDEPKAKCETLPSAEKYIPKLFTTTALQQMKVDLTWDETDPQRQRLTERVHDPKEKIDDEDLRAYLGSSSSEDEGIEGDSAMRDDNSGSDDDKKSNVDPISKYRNLLESIENEEKKKKDKDVEMEITWGVGLKKTTENLVKKKMEDENLKKMTPWEEMLAKKQEKKKAKRAGKKPVNKDSESSESDDDDGKEDQPFSDDDVDVDMNDPFFQEELALGPSKKSKKKKNKNKGLETTDNQNPEDAAALELLLMDEEGEKKHHFSLKKILENENADEKKSKKKRKLKKKKGDFVQKKESTDNFEIDLKDDRFKALYTSHTYNVDPSDPNFKNTKSMSAIINEKQKRRQQFSNAEEKQRLPAPNANIVEVKREEGTKESSPTPSKISKKSSSSELASLVKSIKRNTEQFKQKKHKFGKST